MKPLLAAMLLATSAASGIIGARLAVLIKDGGHWSLSIWMSLLATGSWALTLRYWPGGGVLIASVLWNLTHESRRVRDVLSS